ncbi:hypothetical protein [uncultured Kordia sp.]|uniref:hypothetical protein n=1 Tax=uncultured Kordia sp. TaxID=507699 RepID=UPI00260741FB|nr:hypothetical protein [uncultured Kordia sp.]
MLKQTFIKKILFGLIVATIASCGNQNDKTEFTWDFSTQKKYRYSISQMVVSENKMYKDQPASLSNMIGNGNLNIRVKENNLADLSLTNMEVRMIVFDENGKAKDTISNTPPTNVTQDMKPNGTFVSDNHNFIFDIIFPLPSKELKIGETDKIPLQIPYNANGSRLFIKGFNTLEFVGIESFNGKECAVLKGKIDISNLEIPEELDGTYEGSSIGNGTYYFDIKKQCFVGADVQMTMVVLMDTETDKNDMGMYAKMKSDNEFKIRLEEIDE